MYRKSIEMSFNQAAEISIDLLFVLHCFFKQYNKPIKISLWDEESDQNNFCPDIIYPVQNKIDSRYFELTFFGDPDDLGYCSILPDYDPSTYVLCNIVEKRPNKTKKYEMTFGFDIEKGTFLELFEIVHYNTVGIMREYPNLNTPLEAKLKDTIILSLPNATTVFS